MIWRWVFRWSIRLVCRLEGCTPAAAEYIETEIMKEVFG